jgi:two-component system LytT family sensor kinase
MNIRQLEFWIATLLVTVSLSASLAWMGGEGQNAVAEVRQQFWSSGMSFNYVFNYFLPNILPPLIYYAGFLAVMFIAFPRYYEQKQYNAFVGALLIILAVITAFLTLNGYLKEPGINDVYTIRERQVGRMVHFLDRALIQGFRFIAVMAGYLVVREILVPRLMAQKNKSTRIQAFFAHFQVFLFVWMPVIASVFFVRRDAFRFMLFIGFCALPLAFLIHALNYNWLIPYKEQKRMAWWKYWPLYFVTSFAIVFPVVILFDGLVGSESHDLPEILFLSWIWLLILVTPFSWIVYRYGSKTTGRLNQLRSALSTSNASLDFLKSQINPHFLFNALNTLYGTAIQENSDKTAQGIQKLGDMMRFMLYDNLQDSIPLSKEIHYMRNYIDLQKLRTLASDKIRIDTSLEEAACQHSIAPMLLIPFVENAFKHGISLIRPSWIKVSLTCTPDRVYFDVYNSLHASPDASQGASQDTDPESENSGVGLDNVRQRLALLYPMRHELTIHESQTEYFIHLTILFPHGK